MPLEILLSSSYYSTFTLVFAIRVLPSVIEYSSLHVYHPPHNLVGKLAEVELNCSEQTQYKVLSRFAKYEVQKFSRKRMYEALTVNTASLAEVQ